jgi:hypothetical protein
VKRRFGSLLWFGALVLPGLCRFPSDAGEVSDRDVAYGQNVPVNGKLLKQYPFLERFQKVKYIMVQPSQFSVTPDQLDKIDYSGEFINVTFDKNGKLQTVGLEFAKSKSPRRNFCCK